MCQMKKSAKVAGVLYLLMGITAPIGLIYVPGTLIVAGDASATANHLRASASLQRIGIASELFHQVIFVFLALTLYSLMKAVGERHARLMVVLAVLSVPIVFLDTLNQIAALTLVSGADFLSVFERRQLDSLAYLFLRLYGQGIAVATIFWGLWLFPFGILVIRSRFIPRVFGFLLLVAGLGNLASSITSLLLPEYAHAVSHYSMILGFGELPIVFWFLIWGTRDQTEVDGPSAPDTC
jgi:hypothetical protein